MMPVTTMIGKINSCGTRVMRPSRVSISPECTASETPISITSTMPSGPKWEKLVTISSTNLCNPCCEKRFCASTVSRLTGWVTETPSSPVTAEQAITNRVR